MRDFQLVLKRAPKDENALKKKDECDKVRAVSVCDSEGSTQNAWDGIIRELNVHVMVVGGLATAGVAGTRL
jgi:hypothetical protein